MFNATTVLNQLQHLLPLQQFQRFVGQHNGDRYAKKMTCRNQLSILLYAQATGKNSLRDIETSLLVEHKRWYHLGLNTIARSTLAKANERRPYQIYESLFYKLVEQCQILRSGTAEFSFQNDLKAIDASTIDLCLNLFPWAHFRKAKGAIKLHTVLDIRSQIPEMVIITDGKCSDIRGIRDMDLSQYAKGTIFVIDRGYTDYAFLKKIKDAGHHFVIRRKKGAQTITLEQHRNATGKGVLKDERIGFVLEKAREAYPDDLRLVTFHDVEHDVLYEFLTDEFRLSAANIAAIYKRRWDIELFFKWVKQHLKIKTFLGTSKNAVLTQIWIAMIYYLLLAWVKFQTKFKGSLLDLTRIVQTALLKQVSLLNLLSLTPQTVAAALQRGSPDQASLF
jgi:transposase